MSSIAEVETVETRDGYVHVRFRDPETFQTIRAPEWAQWVAASVTTGAQVRTGKRAGSEKWQVQSVLIEQGIDEEQARERAMAIAAKIDS